MLMKLTPTVNNGHYFWVPRAVVVLRFNYYIQLCFVLVTDQLTLVGNYKVKKIRVQFFIYIMKKSSVFSIPCAIDPIFLFGICNPMSSAMNVGNTEPL